MSLIDKNWFTEIAPEADIALSLKTLRKLHEEQTPFQNIEIYETSSFGNLMVIDGCVMLSQRDNFLYHEMMTHPAIAIHPRPRDVIIIGGGDCGTLREVLKHDDISRVTQIDIDERVTRLSEQWFPELCESNDDPRAHLEFTDGIRWMDEADDQTADLIIVDSTDPVGPAVGLFQQPFYDNCLRVLRPDGMLVQQSESPILHLPVLTAMHKLLADTGFAGTRIINFPQPVYPSGWWSASVGMKHVHPIESRLSTAALQGLKTRYYNETVHAAAFAVPEFVREAIPMLDTRAGSQKR